MAASPTKKKGSMNAGYTFAKKSNPKTAKRRIAAKRPVRRTVRKSIARSM